MTLVALLGVPLQAFGAKGSNLAAQVTPLVGAVSPGELLAYRAYFKNNTTSPMTHFGFSGSFADAATAATLVSVVGDDGLCGTIGQTSVSCNFGGLAAGAERELVLIFRAPELTPEALATLSFTGAFSADSSSKGKPSGSQREQWSATATVNVDAGGDFFGAWQPAHGGTTAFGPFGATQVTEVFVDSYDEPYVVHMRHTSASLNCGIGTITGWGKTIELSLADGDTPIAFRIKLPSAAGLNPQQVRIAHFDPLVAENNPTADPCTYPPRVAGCEASVLASCYDAYWQGSGPIRFVEVFGRLPHNGSVKGF